MVILHIVILTILEASLGKCAQEESSSILPDRTNKIEDIFLRYYNGSSVSEYVDFPLSQACQLLDVKGFDRNNPTVLYMHGFIETAQQESVQVMVSAYLEARPDTNVILLDWSNMSHGSYLLNAARNTKKVGQAAAEQINNLIAAGLLQDKLHLIGHSLGSHVAGYTARELKNKYNKTVKRLTALDPAFPAFYPNGIVMDHVSSSDAEFVDVIHTDAGGYGAPVRTGTVDFWPNGGNSVQPGCPRFAPIPLSDDSSTTIEIGCIAEEKQGDSQIIVTTQDISQLDLKSGAGKKQNETRGSNGQTCAVGRNVAFVKAFRQSWKDGDLCSHWRSWRFYAESVRNPEAFPASPAASYQKFLDNPTPETGMVYMGYNCDTSAEGSYYLTTNGQSPFGKGIDGLYPKRKKSKK